MERSAICVFVGALVGAAATYGVMKNKDKIVEEFEKLEGKLETTLKERGISAERAKEMYQKASDNVHSSMDKIKDMLHSKNIEESDKDQIIKEIEALKAKVTKIF